MSNATVDIRRAAAQVAEQASEGIAQLTAELDLMRAERKTEEDRIKAEIAELRALQRRYSPHQGGPSRTAKRNGNGRKTPAYAGTRVTAEVADIILANFNGTSFTATEVARLSKLHNSSVRNGIGKLRESEAIRASHRERVGNGRIPSQFYQVMDRDTLVSLSSQGDN